MARTIALLVFVAALVSYSFVQPSSLSTEENEGAKEQGASEILNRLKLLEDQMLRQAEKIGEQEADIALLKKALSRCGGCMKAGSSVVDQSMIPKNGKANSPMKDALGQSSRPEEKGLRNKLSNTSAQWKESTPLNASIFSNASRHNVVTRGDDVNPLAASLAHVTQEVDKMAAKMAALDAAVSNAASSTFVRWGSDECGSHADTVYHGLVGGSWYSHPGAAANYLCLPTNPVLSSHSNTYASAYLYGAEYETQEANQDREAVCAVCRAGYPTTIMTPATNVCPSAWTKQYDGYLMAGAVSHGAASEYICVDPAMKAVTHSSGNDEGKLLYYTQTLCGSLACPPYEHGKVVTCVVCSK